MDGLPLLQIGGGGGGGGGILTTIIHLSMYGINSETLFFVTAEVMYMYFLMEIRLCGFRLVKSS